MVGSWRWLNGTVDIVAVVAVVRREEVESKVDSSSRTVRVLVRGRKAGVGRIWLG